MHGFLNVNKPEGLTSFDVIRKLKRKFPRKTKLGHLGTLDPMARGVLPVAVGNATKIIPFVADGSKEYIASMIIGGCSDTQDAWGQITYAAAVALDLDKLKSVMKAFQGKIQQIPPMFSAVHHEGKRLYELARQGITVERAAREALIESIELLDSDLARDYPQISFKVLCSKGTYIRTLCHDIGEEMGTGAFLSALLRSQAGAFKIEDAVPLEHIMDAQVSMAEFLLAIDFPLAEMPAIKLNSQQITAVLNGRPILLDQACPPGKIRIYSPQQELQAIADSESQGERTLIKPIRVLK